MTTTDTCARCNHYEHACVCLPSTDQRVPPTDAFLAARAALRPGTSESDEESA